MIGIIAEELAKKTFNFDKKSKINVRLFMEAKKNLAEINIAEEEVWEKGEREKTM